MFKPKKFTFYFFSQCRPKLKECPQCREAFTASYKRLLNPPNKRFLGFHPICNNSTLIIDMLNKLMVRFRGAERQAEKLEKLKEKRLKLKGYNLNIQGVFFKWSRPKKF